MQFRRCKKNYRYLIHFLSYWEKGKNCGNLPLEGTKELAIGRETGPTRDTLGQRWAGKGNKWGN